MNHPPTHLCPAHSSRQTHSRECTDCQHTKRLAGYDRRINELEKQVERLEIQLAALEIVEAADTPKVEA